MGKAMAEIAFPWLKQFYEDNTKLSVYAWVEFVKHCKFASWPKYTLGEFVPGWIYIVPSIKKSPSLSKIGWSSANGSLFFLFLNSSFIEHEAFNSTFLKPSFFQNESIQ